MGGWLIYLGIERGSNYTLEGIDKRVTLEQITNACRLMKKYENIYREMIKQTADKNCLKKYC